MVGTAAYMVKVKIKLSQLPTKLKLKLGLAKDTVGNPHQTQMEIGKNKTSRTDRQTDRQTKRFIYKDRRYLKIYNNPKMSENIRQNWALFCKVK